MAKVSPLTAVAEIQLLRSDRASAGVRASRAAVKVTLSAAETFPSGLVFLF